MNTKKEYDLSINQEIFDNLRSDFDLVLQRAVGNMKMKGAEEATLTLKLSIVLEEEEVYDTDENGNESDVRMITKPSFSHEVSSVMQVKDKKKGALSGEYNLVWDSNAKKYVVCPIDNGQTSLFDENENSDDITPDENNILLLNGEVNNDVKFGYFKQFIGKDVVITNTGDNYQARTVDDEILIASSAANEDSMLYCDADILKEHQGHKLSVVGYYNEPATPDEEPHYFKIAIECKDCECEIFEVNDYETPVYVTNETFVEDDFNVSDDGEDYEYDEPEE